MHKLIIPPKRQQHEPQHEPQHDKKAKKASVKKRGTVLTKSTSSGRLYVIGSLLVASDEEQRAWILADIKSQNLRAKPCVVASPSALLVGRAVYKAHWHHPGRKWQQ